MPTSEAVDRPTDAERGARVGRRAGGSLHRTLAALAFGISLLVLSVTNAIDAIGAGSIGQLAVAVLPIALALIVVLTFRLDRHIAGPAVGTDALTGLADRPAALDFLRAEMTSHTGRAPAIVLFDLDRFSEFCRENGGGAANGVLRAFATILREQTRRANLSARVGSNRFLAVLRDATRDDAVTFAARVHDRFRDAADTAALPTASVGIAFDVAVAADPLAMIALAERALRTAKLEGGDRIRVEAGTRATGGTEPAHEPDDPLHAPGGETILVVDDDAPIRELARRILIDADYRVLTAADGRHALDTLAAHTGPIHLVLSDISMPRLNGHELAAYVGLNRPEIRILLMSGFIDDPGIDIAIQSSRWPFLSKPFTREELLAKVHGVLQG